MDRVEWVIATILSITFLGIVLLLNNQENIAVQLTGNQINPLAGNQVSASINLNPLYYEVEAGEELLIELEISKEVEEWAGRKDIEIKTSIIIPLEEKIRLDHQTIALDTQALKLISVRIPATLPTGEYMLLIEISDSINKNIIIATNKTIFVKNRLSLSPLEDNNLYYYSLGIFILSILTLFITIILTRKK